MISQIFTMGKSKKSKKKAFKKNSVEESKNDEKKESINSTPAVDSSTYQKLDNLVEEAVSLIDSFNYDEAELKLREVLATDAHHTKSLEMLSDVYTEQFKWEEAKKLLRHCIEIEPETGHNKYFSIAQLCNGLEAVGFYEKGIQIIEKELENSENIEPSQASNKDSLKRSLSDAYSSVAEIFMTDSCFEENSEEKCCKAIEFSIKADPSNPEAYQCQANYNLVKEDVEEAKQSMQKSLLLWLPQYEELRDRENPVPVYDSRIMTSKLLIELEMFSEASRVLNSLLEEDDEVVDVWYLLGWLNYMRKDGDHKKVAHSYFRKAKKISDGDDDEMVDHIIVLLEELSQSHPITDDEEVLEEDDEEENDDDLELSIEDDEMET